MRHPLGRVPRRRLLHHAVDLFERKPFGLGDEEVRVDEAGETEGAPDEENLGAQVAPVRVDHVGRYDCDDLWRKRKFSVCAFANEGIGEKEGIVEREREWEDEGSFDLRNSRASWKQLRGRRRGNGWAGGRFRR